MNYTTKDFDFDLPEELIAQTPLKDRTSSRLLVVNKTTHTIEDKHFSDLLDELEHLLSITLVYCQHVFMERKKKQVLILRSYY